MSLPWVSRRRFEALEQQNAALRAQLDILGRLVTDYRGVERTGGEHVGRLLALTADHARLQTTVDHLAQLLTLNQHEKAAMLAKIAGGVQLPTPEFAVSHAAPPVVFEGSPGSGVMPTQPGEVAPGVPTLEGRSAIGDALNRIRDERDAARSGRGKDMPTPGVFDDLGETDEEIARNEQLLSAP